MLKHRSYHPVLKVRQREAASSFRLLSELHGCHLGVTKDTKGGESLGSSDFLIGASAFPSNSRTIPVDGP